MITYDIVIHPVTIYPSLYPVVMWERHNGIEFSILQDNSLASVQIHLFFFFIGQIC
jgi:hypothetical protein